MHEQGCQIVRLLKAGELPLRLAVRGFPGFLLRPVVTAPGRLRDQDVRCLTDWRNDHAGAFLTEFVATEERTARWLSHSVHSSDGHLMFMVDHTDGRTLGYMAIGFIDWARASGEADAIVRGHQHIRGLMLSSLITMLLWAKDRLQLQRIGVRVLSDNPALAFYRRIGFVETRRVPLRRVEHGSEPAWIEDPASTCYARSLVHHDLCWRTLEHVTKEIDGRHTNPTQQ